jgi:hypothetical protein
LDPDSNDHLGSVYVFVRLQVVWLSRVLTFTVSHNYPYLIPTRHSQSQAHNKRDDLRDGGGYAGTHVSERELGVKILFGGRDTRTFTWRQGSGFAWMGKDRKLWTTESNKRVGVVEMRMFGVATAVCI